MPPGHLPSGAVEGLGLGSPMETNEDQVSGRPQSSQLKVGVLHSRGSWTGDEHAHGWCPWLPSMPRGLWDWEVDTDSMTLPNKKVKKAKRRCGNDHLPTALEGAGPRA